MTFQMQITVIGVCPDFGCQCELLVIHRIHQIGETGVAIAPSTGNVGCVTGNFGAGIN